VTDPIPRRPGVAQLYRQPLERLEARLRLPAVNPSWYSAASLALSAATLLVPAWGAQALLVAGALIADWLDGATARRFGLTSRRGHVTDVVSDRVGELLVILGGWGTVPATAFLGLWGLNVLLTGYSLATGRHRVLPLRFAWLLALLVTPWWPGGWAGNSVAR
jgi:phosphatidylglycerophosphate synthase